MVNWEQNSIIYRVMKQESTRLMKLNKHAITNVHEKSITTRKNVKYIHVRNYLLSELKSSKTGGQNERVCRMAISDVTMIKLVHYYTRISFKWSIRYQIGYLQRFPNPMVVQTGNRIPLYSDGTGGNKIDISLNEHALN